MSNNDTERASVASKCAVQRSERRGKHVGPYSISEMRALSELVTRTRNSIRNLSDQMTPEQYNQIWVDIANCMHANGWPRRSWRRLRLKAQRMLTTSMENGARGPATTNQSVSVLNSALLPLPCSTASLKNGVTTTVTTTSCVGLPANAQPSDVGSVAVSSVQSCKMTESTSVSLISATTPPPLLSFSEASAENVMKLTNSTRICSNDVTTPPGGRTTGPQIVHVCSKALTSCAGSNETCPPKQVPNLLTLPAQSILSTVLGGASVLEVPNNDFLNCSDRIDLCASSDEDEDNDVGLLKSYSPQPRVSEAISYVPTSIGHSTNSVPPIFHSGSAPVSEPVGSLTAIEFWKRMEIYNMKLEILKLKRDYWAEKLRTLSSTQ